jgi:outer membrane protein assembly factor BamB
MSAIPGAVFAGGWDGVMRVLATDDGRVLWQYNMVHARKDPRADENEPS